MIKTFLPIMVPLIVSLCLLGVEGVGRWGGGRGEVAGESPFLLFVLFFVLTYCENV